VPYRGHSVRPRGQLVLPAWRGALRLLRKAYDVEPTPHAAGQLGLCEQALGQWAEAEVDVIRSLAGETDPWVRKNRPTLIQDLQVIRSHLGRVEIHGEPAGARVTVNGKEVGVLPLPEPVRVAAGEVGVVIAAPGYVTASQTVHLDADHYEHVTLVATPVAPASLAAADPLATPTPPSGAPPAREGAAWRPRDKWIAWGAGAVAAAVGIYGAAENLHLVHVFEGAGCSVDDAGRAVNISGMPDTLCASKKSDYESASHLAIGAFVSAGVLGAAGAILWLTEPKDEGSKTAWTTACRPSLNERLEPWLACALRF
jgi:hypothetical protein